MYAFHAAIPITYWFAIDIAIRYRYRSYPACSIARGPRSPVAARLRYEFRGYFLTSPSRKPAKFPLDTVMFTGSWDQEEQKKEHPEEYQRLKASGAIEKYLVPPPSNRWNRLSHLFGFILLGVGLVLLILVIDGFMTRGLF
uniref:Uncharacterized protein n=1 Tax=Candidatus Kentrum sp. FM TaxID=2126340 RepID=A0A450SV73_9GAMM|nr:MAG: hypothetical protein BECKFM1743A_GA0114220_1002318 [Candidatus Kentron sp. FM]VFJ57894.1 MAG: hypothetical protein BECKFM1743C_GA0114222_102125 [Candidatus Kentron sp. FM]VFK16590.1 MAG: hypothetical protein BECKFM1743B_GA0114221_104286 [Candidatus Kentron sp. FM]